MTWFKVDDKFWSHPKVLHTSSTAIGVWARVGSYCADHLSDGLVDMRTVHAICPDPRKVIDRAVAELVATGLWEVLGENAARRYHDWTDHQPTRAEVEDRREAEREKKRRQRRNRAGQFTVVPGGKSDPVPLVSRGDSLGESRG